MFIILLLWDYIGGMNGDGVVGGNDCGRDAKKKGTSIHYQNIKTRLGDDAAHL